MSPETEIRPMALADAAEVAEIVRLGFESYREWAPRGWDPPPPEHEAARIRERLGWPGAWGVLALRDGRLAGHVALLPATDPAGPGEPAPGLAHLWMLFVRREWWGSGLAGELHDLVVAEAARQGYETMRLYTPAAHARARAFYERRGWRAEAAPFPEPMIGLDLVEYRRSLT